MAIRLPDMDPCYFCEIAQGRAERWNVIEETPLTVTLLNGRQFEVGQCIVVPVSNAPTLLELSADEDAAIMVPHFHLHVVPRRQASDWGFGPPHLARLAERGRAAHADHRAVTDLKRQTVEEIRREMARLKEEGHLKVAPTC